MKQVIITLDFESVLIPEAWPRIAEVAKVDALRATTREFPNYAELMQTRISLLKENNISFKDALGALANEKPLSGAADFLAKLRKKYQVILISDTFIEFAKPLLGQLNDPTMFCHMLEVDSDGMISGYVLRKNGSKQEVIKALKNIGYFVVSMGDSFNDVAMLREADKSAFIFASEAVLEAHSDISKVSSYDVALEFIHEAASQSA